MKQLLWLDGKRADGNAIPVSTDSTLWRGQGWFETVAVSQGEPLNLPAHLDRLFRSAPDLTFSTNQLIDELTAMARDWGDEPGRLKIVVWEEGKQIRYASWIRPLQPPAPEQYEQGVDLVVEARSHPPRWPLQDEKRTSYAGVMESRSRTNKWGVLFTDREGRVWECGIANFFWWDGESLRIPPMDHHILIGTVLEALVDRAEQYGIPVREEPFTVEDVTRDGWVANSTSGLLPVRSLDNRKLTLSEPNPVQGTLRPALASDKVISLWHNS